MLNAQLADVFEQSVNKPFSVWLRPLGTSGSGFEYCISSTTPTDASVGAEAGRIVTPLGETLYVPSQGWTSVFSGTLYLVLTINEGTLTYQFTTTEPTDYDITDDPAKLVYEIAEFNNGVLRQIMNRDICLEGAVIPAWYANYDENVTSEDGEELVLGYVDGDVQWLSLDAFKLTAGDGIDISAITGGKKVKALAQLSVELADSVTGIYESGDEQSGGVLKKVLQLKNDAIDTTLAGKLMFYGSNSGQRGWHDFAELVGPGVEIIIGMRYQDKKLEYQKATLSIQVTVAPYKFDLKLTPGSWTTVTTAVQCGS